MSEQQTNPLDDDTIDPTIPPVDELVALKARADMMGVPYHPSIGLQTLKDKIAAKLAGTPETAAASLPKPDAVEAPQEPEIETAADRRTRKRREANELVRVRVACMNPTKKEWEGEFFSAGNSLIGTYTKYVPFNNEAGWHVPRIILNMMRERKCQIFVSKRDSRGNSVREAKMINEFSIEILPSLTLDEMRELAAQQGASNSIEK